MFLQSCHPPASFQGKWNVTSKQKKKQTSLGCIPLSQSFFGFRQSGLIGFSCQPERTSEKRLITQQGAFLKPDRDTNLNDPRSEVDRSDCNLRARSIDPIPE